ncbi:Uncharacterised protein [uncultured archaeon]|nr:Uncharacterised protein [uncultured archaeon]
MAPVGVKILSILAYIGAVVTLILGIVMLFGANFLSGFLSQWVPVSGFLVGSMIVFVGVVFIALAVLDYFVGRGLWSGQNWARILVLIFSVLSVLGSLRHFDIVNIVIDAVIIWYLGFNKEAVNYFK